MTVATSYYEVDVAAYAQNTLRTFTYLHVSNDSLKPGQIVQVPFGNRLSLGIIIANAYPPHGLQNKIKPIHRVLDYQPLPKTLLQLSEWLKKYYASSSHSVWGAILPSGLTQKRRSAHIGPQTTQPLNIEYNKVKLSAEQQAAYNKISSASKPTLLYGVTGSGKTHIYEKLINDQLINGQSVLFVVPEIFLTQQLFSRLESSFAGLIVLTHSGLTAARRRNIWLDTLDQKQARLYIGPRSSLFLPINKLGLIILDEAHDASYKQENQPRYHARDVAAQLANITKAKLLFGSATPEIISLWLAKQKRLCTVRLANRHAKSQIPKTRIVDTKHYHSPLSPELIAAIKIRLSRGEQCLLMHNKRGSARRLTCEDCGTSQICPRCDVNLIFHADEGRLRCHICGYTIFPPTICPICHSTNLRYFGFGTKQLADEVEKTYSQARIARIDRDNNRAVDLKAILKQIEAGDIDIIIGTQMIAKGLDFAKLTLVSIIDGDDLLSGNDFQSRERGVALIIQTAGRSGRKNIAGEVIIQTRQPDNPLWQTICQHNWDNFANTEMERRQEFIYPPYCYLARLSFKASSANKAHQAANEWVRDITLPPDTVCLGPAPPNQPKIGSSYISNLIIKTTHRSRLTKIALSIPKNCIIDIDPISIF